MPKPVPARPYHHGDLREQLLNAGELALADLPLEKVTLREIARRASVSHAAPKHHFPSLGHLLGEIAARGFTQFVTSLETAAQSAAPQTPHARLQAMSQAYLRFANENRTAYRLMFGTVEGLVRTENLEHASGVAWQQLRRAVSQIVPERESDAAAFHVWSSVHGIAMLKLAQRIPPGFPMQAIEHQVIKMALAGLNVK